MTAEDSAPDGTAVWSYTYETKAVKLRAQQPQGNPRFPVAGKRFVVSTVVVQETDGSRVTSGIVQCNARLAGKPLAAKPSFAAGLPSCAMTVPKTARGKILTGSIAVATQAGQVRGRSGSRCSELPGIGVVPGAGRAPRRLAAG